MTAPVLEARDLSISFGGLRAVDDVSFAAERNRITTIIGPNGAGKSTLFNLISGALRPQSGAVFVEGVEYTGAPPYRMQAAGVARSFQITNLFFDLPVAENLRLAAQVLEPAAQLLAADLSERHRAARVWPSCSSVSASPTRRDLRSAQLSHGEQRRLEVAVALAGKPKVLLLDEPTQGMSHGDTEDTAALIRSLAAEVTVLLIEHDIGLVMNLSDHVIVMHQGQQARRGYAGIRARQSRGAGRLFRTRLTMLAIEDLHTHYGASHVVQGIDLAVRRRRGGRRVRTQRRRQDHAAQDHRRLDRASRGEIRLRRRAHRRRRADRICRLGVGFVPEDRRIFPGLTVEENLTLGFLQVPRRSRRRTTRRR